MKRINTISTGVMGLVFSLCVVLIGIPDTQAAKWKIGKDGSTVAADASQTLGDDQAIDRTRQQIHMLDDLYKTAVVLITEHYVTDPSILNAATAAKALFAEMQKKGWHEARLVGLTDVINNPENEPKDDFERIAAEKLRSGQQSHEEVVVEDGKRYLRMATPVPVVMEKCVMCHENFEGDTGAVGALAYKVPVIE